MTQRQTDRAPETSGDTPARPTLPPHQSHVTGLGNRQTQQLLAVQRWSQYEPMDDDRAEQKAEDTAMRQSGAAAVAAKAYAALSRGISGGRDAVQALGGYSAPMRSDIQREFQSAYGTPLIDMVADKLCPHGHPNDSGIYALALLQSSHVHDLHVAVAMAILPTGHAVRNAELDRILTSVNSQGVPAVMKLRELYGDAFSRAKEGSLPKDLRAALSGAELHRALALIDHKITVAEELWTETSGVLGTKNASAVNRIFATWDKGPAEFAKLELDWEQYVRNKNGWTDEPLAAAPLREAMLGEFNHLLSERHWNILEATFDGYDRWKTGMAEARAGGGAAEAKYSDFFGDDPNDPVAKAYGAAKPAPPGREEARHAFLQKEFTLAIQLEVARGTYEAAVVNGFEDHVLRNAEAIGRIHDERKAAAALTGDESLVRKIEYQAERDLKNMKGSLLKSDVGAQSDVYQKSRLLLEGSLDMADRVWLSTKDDQPDKTIELITTAWAQMKLPELRAQAAKPRYATDSEHVANRVKIRPEFDVALSIPDTWGDQRRKITHLLEPGNLFTQGAHRLWYEINHADDKDGAVAFMKTPGLEPGARLMIVVHYVNRNFTDDDKKRHAPGGGADQQFVSWFSERYGNAKACMDMADLVTPARSFSEIVDRAEKRYLADASWFADVASVFTGEDSNQVAAESLERLRFIAGFNPPDLGPLMILTGASNPMELATLEYDFLQARLADIANIKKLVAEALATVVETAVKAFVTAALGPGGVLYASLAGNVAGMLVREFSYGNEYDLISTANAMTLAKTAAGEYTGKIGGRALSEFGLDEARLLAMGRIGQFASATAEEAGGELFDTAIGGVYNISGGGKIPSGEDILEGAVELALKTSGAGAGAAAKYRKEIKLDAILAQRDAVWDAATGSLTKSLWSETTAVAKNFSDLTPGEIGARYANATYSVLKSMALSSSTQKLASHVFDFSDIGAAGAEGLQEGAELAVEGVTSKARMHARIDKLVEEARAESPKLPAFAPSEQLIPVTGAAADSTTDVLKMLEELEEDQGT